MRLIHSSIIIVLVNPDEQTNERHSEYHFKSNISIIKTFEDYEYFIQFKIKEDQPRGNKTINQSSKLKM